MPRLKAGLSAGEYATLGLLRKRPMHGYDIARRFTAELDLGLVLPLDMSTVYALLKDLQEQGLLEGRRETIGLRPPCTVYALSADAEAQFLHWLQEPVSRLRGVRLDLLVKLHFCRSIGSRCSAQLLDAQLDESRAYLNRLTRLTAEAPPESFEHLVRVSNLTAAQATRTWLETERRQLAG